MPRRDATRRASAPTPVPVWKRAIVGLVALGVAGGVWALVRQSRAKAAAGEIALAENLMAGGDPAQAARVLEAMRERGLDPVERRIVLAVAYGKTNDPKALVAAKEATDAAPDSLRAHMALLSAYTRVYDKPHAMAELRVAERLAPPDSTELCLFGAHYAASTHDWDAVEEQARRCVAIDPKLGQAWYSLGLALGQSSSSERWAEAETSLRKSLALVSDLYPAWLELGSVYVRMDRDADAVDALERARAIVGPLVSAADGGTRQQLQDLIRLDHLLGKAYHRRGLSAKEAEMRRECDDLNERMQRLPAR